MKMPYKIYGSAHCQMESTDMTRKKRKITHYGVKTILAGFTGYSGWCSSIQQMDNFWIGTYEGGLYRVDPFRKDIDRFFTPAPVCAFNEDSANGFWIGTSNGLIFRSKKTGSIQNVSS